MGIIILNIHTPNMEYSRTSSIVEEIILDLKPETDPQTVIASNFDTSLLLIDMSSSQKLTEKTCS